MSETVIVANNAETKTAPAMGKFERYLTLWVALCFIAGIALGQVIPRRVPRHWRGDGPVQQLCRRTHRARDRPLHRQGTRLATSAT